MKRYQNSSIRDNIIRRGKDKTTYRIVANNSIVYSSVPEHDQDIWVITQPGDRLDLLAHQFYGDVTLWWYIAKANNLTVMILPAGTSLRIPSTTQYAIGR